MPDRGPLERCGDKKNLVPCGADLSRRRSMWFAVRAGASALLAASLLAVCSAADAGSASIDNSLACQFASQKYVRDLLGLANSERTHTSTSPTSPSPSNHTVGPGSDKSSCNTFAWNGKKPSLSQLRKIIVPGPSRYKVPSGLGAVLITTYVRDPGTEGQHWDASAFYGGLLIAAAHDRHQLGGQDIKVKKYGADDRDALTLGHYGDFADGVWLKGDSIIVLQVAASSGRAAAKLKTLAAKAVPPF